MLLLGRTLAAPEEAERQLELEDFELLAGTRIDDARSAFANRRIDHVITRARLDLATRLESIRDAFERSDTTSIHMKERGTGPEGFLPFVRAILADLKDTNA